MSQTFANSINNNPIYADRAEKDAAGNTISTTYATKSELPSGVPAVTSSDDSKVLKATYSGGVGSYAWETESGGGTTYTTGSTASVTISTDDTVVVNSADVTGITIGSGVNSCVVQWTVSSTTTLPTITADTGNSYTYKAAGNNPAALTVGKTYQLSVLRDCWVIAEFG